MYGNQPMNTNFDVYYKDRGNKEIDSTRARACFHRMRDMYDRVDHIEFQSVHYVPYINDVAATQFHGDYQKLAMEYYNDLLNTDVGKYVSMNSSDPDLVFPVIDVREFIDCEYDEDYEDVEGEQYEDAEIFEDLDSMQGFNVIFSDNSTTLFCLQVLRIPQEFPDCLAMYQVMKRAGFSTNHALLGSWMYKIKNHKASLESEYIKDADTFMGGGHSPVSSKIETDDLVDFIDNGALPSPENTNSFRSPFHKEYSKDGWVNNNGFERLLSIKRDDIVGYVGVYGTLKKGHPNHTLIRNSPMVTAGSITLPMKMVTLGSFPALISSEDHKEIYMEIYGLNKEEYHDVERLEGYPDLYNRFSFLHEGLEVEAYYMEDARNNEEVIGGRW